MKLAAFRLDPAILDGLQAIKIRDGVPVSEQVRRALIAWLAEKGIDATGSTKRSSTRSTRKK